MVRSQAGGEVMKYDDPVHEFADTTECTNQGENGFDCLTDDHTGAPDVVCPRCYTFQRIQELENRWSELTSLIDAEFRSPAGLLEHIRQLRFHRRKSREALEECLAWIADTDEGITLKHKIAEVL